MTRAIAQALLLLSACSCSAERPAGGRRAAAETLAEPVVNPRERTDVRVPIPALRCEDGEAASWAVVLAAIPAVRKRFSCLRDPSVGTHDAPAAAPIWVFGRWREGVARGHWQFVRATSELSYGTWETVGLWDGKPRQPAAYAGTLRCSQHEWVVQSHRHKCKTY